MFYHLHPYKPYIKVNTTCIIVGTLPPPRFSTRELNYNDVDFSYGSSSGLLWKVLDSIFDLKLDYKNTRLAVKQRKNFLDKNDKKDFDKAAEDLRLATRHLGMIVGKVDVEEILGSIFNDFCIGK